MSADPKRILPSAVGREPENEILRLPFLEHLGELRERVVRISIGVALASVLAFYWVAEIFELLSAPINQHFTGMELIGTGPTEAFIMKLKLALAAGLVLSAPYSFYQVWRFISPGLYDRERRVALPFVVVSTAFFLGGIWFCHSVMLPYAFDFFNAEYTSIGVKPNIRIGEHLAFTVKMMLVFGVVFETPVLSYFLARLGVLRHTMLLRGWRYIIVGIFIVAGVLTPPDVVTQLLLAAPLLLLYGLSILVVKVAERPLASAE